MSHRSKKFQLDGYEIRDPALAYLGEGTYGTVFSATEKSTGRLVAIKQHHDIAHELGVSSSVLRETTVLRLLRNSPYVVKLLDVVHHQKAASRKSPTCHMIFEHLDCDLHSYAANQRPMSSDIIQRIMYHVLLGLHHCHFMGLMHRDLKPHNILLEGADTKNPTAKLCDFGFGRTFTAPIRQLTQEIITLWYRPPEVLLGYNGHSPAVDIWSVGCILSELYEGRTLFRGQSQYDQLLQIFNFLGTPTVSEWLALPTCEYWHAFPAFERGDLGEKMRRTPAVAVDLLKHMLAHNPAKRPSTEQCLRHPYFASIFNEADLRMRSFSETDTRFQRIVMPDAALLPSTKPEIVNGHVRS